MWAEVDCDKLDYVILIGFFMIAEQYINTYSR